MHYEKPQHSENSKVRINVRERRDGDKSDAPEMNELRN